jgi:hypothetical protein
VTLSPFPGSNIVAVMCLRSFGTTLVQDRGRFHRCPQHKHAAIHAASRNIASQPLSQSERSSEVSEVASAEQGVPLLPSRVMCHPPLTELSDHHVVMALNSDRLSLSQT